MTPRLNPLVEPPLRPAAAWSAEARTISGRAATSPKPSGQLRADRASQTPGSIPTTKEKPPFDNNRPLLTTTISRHADSSKTLSPTSQPRSGHPREEAALDNGRYPYTAALLVPQFEMADLRRRALQRLGDVLGRETRTVAVPIHNQRTEPLRPTGNLTATPSLLDPRGYQLRVRPGIPPLPSWRRRPAA